MKPSQDLYQGILLEHGNSPRNRRRLEDPKRTGTASNPLCGDRLDVDVRLGDRGLEEVAFEGYLCAVSQASASLMTEAVRGRSPAEARALGERLATMLRSGEEGADLGELEALRAVRAYRVRIRCALLPWEALRGAIPPEGS